MRGCMKKIYLICAILIFCAMDSDFLCAAYKEGKKIPSASYDYDLGNMITSDLGNTMIFDENKIFVFQISSEKTGEISTTKENIKKIYKQFSKFDKQERLLFDDILEGFFSSGISFTVKGNKEKLSKTILDYYENKKQAVPPEVKAYLLKISDESSNQKFKKYVELLNKELAGEDNDFVERVKSLSAGIFESEKKLKKIKNFKTKLETLGLMEKDEKITPGVKCLWEVLLKYKGISEEIVLMSLDDAFKLGRIYIKN
jgi:hypothetical protein